MLPADAVAMVYGIGGPSEKCVALLGALATPIVVLGNPPLTKLAVVGVEAVLPCSGPALALAACDFLRWAAGLDKWLRPAGLPRRTEHF
jgi:hypothetical protein